MEREWGATASLSATEYAARREPGHPVRWDLLEAAAFREVSSVFARVPSAEIRAPRSIRDLLLWAAAIPVALAPYVGGMAARWPRRFHSLLDASGRIPTAGLSYGLVLVALLVCLAMWCAKGRRWNRLAAVYCGTVVVVGLSTVVGMSVWGGWSRDDSWHLWALPVALSVVLAAVWFVLLVIAYSHAATVSLPRGSALPDAPAVVRRRQIARIPRGTRAEIAADLRAAITDLEERGVISIESAWHAREAELGMLGQRMRERARMEPAD